MLAENLYGDELILTENVGEMAESHSGYVWLELGEADEPAEEACGYRGDERVNSDDLGFRRAVSFWKT